MFETISPSGWGLKLPEKRNARVEELLGYSPEELELRCKNCVYQFLDSLFDEEAGALRHYYRADVIRPLLSRKPRPGTVMPQPKWELIDWVMHAMLPSLSMTDMCVVEALS